MKDQEEYQKEKAEKVLKDLEDNPLGDVISSAYDVLRYAQQGYYTVKGR